MLRYIGVILVVLLVRVEVFGQTNYSAWNVSMTAQVQPEARIDSIVRLYADSLVNIMDRVIGHCTETMHSRRPESPLMRLVADVIMSEGLRFAEENGMELHDAISIFNAGGIRASLKEGDVMVRNIYEISPFENSIVILELTARQMREVTNHIAARGGEAVAGLTMNLEERQARRVKIHGESIDNDKKYTLITLDYVASGGDQFKCLTQIPAYNTGVLFRDAFIRYVERQTAEGKQIEPPTDVRINQIR